MRKSLAAVLLVLLPGFATGPALAGTITGELRILDGTALVDPVFTAKVTTANDVDITLTATANTTNPTSPNEKPVTRFVITFDDTKLPANNRLIKVRMKEASSQDVLLEGLDGKQLVPPAPDGSPLPLVINVIMPTKQPETPPIAYYYPPCYEPQPYVPCCGGRWRCRRW